MSGKLSEQVATAVPPEMKEVVTELAYERRKKPSQLLREVIADECERAPEIDVERRSKECVQLD